MTIIIIVTVAVIIIITIIIITFYTIFAPFVVCNFLSTAEKLELRAGSHPSWPAVASLWLSRCGSHSGVRTGEKVLPDT